MHSDVSDKYVEERMMSEAPQKFRSTDKIWRSKEAPVGRHSAVKLQNIEMSGCKFFKQVKHQLIRIVVEYQYVLSQV
jgi:hypothetical protein